MDKLEQIILEILKGQENGIMSLKRYLQDNYNKNWAKLYQAQNEIFSLSNNSKELKLAGIFIVSQICIGYFKDSLVFLLRKYYESGDLGVKVEVIKALSAVAESQALMIPTMCQVFTVYEVVECVGFVDAVVLVGFYGKMPLKTADGLFIFNNFKRVIVQTEDLKYLSMLNSVLEHNPFLVRYINSDFLEFLLIRLNFDTHEQNQSIIHTLGTYVENAERAFTILLPLKIFDYLLPLIYSIDKLNILLMISNLAGEAEAVVEILILNKGFEEIFYLLNKTGDPRLYKEIIYILHNATLVASRKQVEYFVKIGVVEMLKNLEEVVDEEIWKLISNTFRNLRKNLPALEY